MSTKTTSASQLFAMAVNGYDWATVSEASPSCTSTYFRGRVWKVCGLSVPGGRCL